MKKHKSVVAILLSVMMIFTMMPMMAFATSTTTGGEGASAYTAVWADDFSKVTVNGTEFPTTRHWDGGVITASVSTEGMSSSAIETLPQVAPVKYYDLTGAKLLVAGSQAVKFTQGEFATLFPTDTITNSKVILAQPSYVDNYVANTKSEAMTLNGWTISVDKPEGFVAGSKTDQTFQVAAVITLTGNAADGNTVPFKYGTNPTASLTFLGQATTAGDAEFFFDAAGKAGTGWGNNATVSAFYSGDAHSVVMSEMAGYTATYTVLNKSTGAYEAKAPSVTNVGDTQKVHVVVQNSSVATDKAEFDFTIGVFEAAVPSIYFMEGDVHDDTAEYRVSGSEYNAWDYVEMDTVYIDPRNYSDNTEPTKAEVKAWNAANSKALKANEAELLAYFKEFYDIKATATKANPNDFTLSFDEKDLTSAEETAIAKKYATLIKNFGIEDPADLLESAPYGETATLHTNFNPDFEVEFTKAVTKKTYKANKKGKLAKTKSFTVKAVANNGAKVAYKLVGVDTAKIKINKTTGKITVKKGLKKGTYKFKVKAYVPGASDTWGGAYEFQTITLKIKK